MVVQERHPPHVCLHTSRPSLLLPSTIDHDDQPLRLTPDQAQRDPRSGARAACGLHDPTNTTPDEISQILASEAQNETANLRRRRSAKQSASSPSTSCTTSASTATSARTSCLTRWRSRRGGFLNAACWLGAGWLRRMASFGPILAPPRHRKWNDKEQKIPTCSQPIHGADVASTRRHDARQDLLVPQAQAAAASTPNTSARVSAPCCSDGESSAPTKRVSTLG